MPDDTAAPEEEKPADEQSKEPVDSFKETMDSAINAIVSMRDAGQGFVMSVCVKPVVNLALDSPRPEGVPADAQEVKVNASVAIGGRVPFPPKAVTLIALQALFHNLRQMKGIDALTPQDIAEILGVKVKPQGLIQLPGQGPMPAGGFRPGGPRRRM